MPTAFYRLPPPRLKRLPLLLLAACWAGVGLPGLCSAQAHDLPARLMAGAASASITPGEPCYLAGYGGAGLSKGVHDTLYAKAVVVTGDGGSVAILTLDCVGLMYPDVLRIRARLAKILSGTAFDPGRLVVSSTHTHCGPDVMGLWGKNRFSSGVKPAYMDQLLDISARTVREAWQNQVPATGRWGEGVFGEGWVFNISLPEEIDPSVMALQFRDTTGRSLATLVNFACHPTLIGPEMQLVSADYVGGFYRRMDQELGGVNLFLQGAIGGWVQPVGEATFDHAFEKGAGLAGIALSALDHGASLQGSEVVFRSEQVKIRVRSAGFKLLAALGVIDRKIGRRVLTELVWFEIAGAQFVTHPGESSPYYSFASKALMTGPGPKYVLGLGQDAMGYLLRPEFFDKKQAIPHARYLTKVSVGRQGGPEMMRVIERLSEQE